MNESGWSLFFGHLSNLCLPVVRTLSSLVGLQRHIVRLVEAILLQEIQHEGAVFLVKDSRVAGKHIESRRQGACHYSPWILALRDVSHRKDPVVAEPGVFDFPLSRLLRIRKNKLSAILCIQRMKNLHKD